MPSKPVMELVAILLAAGCIVGSASFQLSPNRYNGSPLSLNRIAHITHHNDALNVHADSNSDDLPPSKSSQHDEIAILQGGSAKAIRLRRQLQSVWNDDPANYSPIILSGPRGSGKSELAKEIVRRLPSAQTRTVHHLTLQDGMDFLDTILGTSSHPGILDDLAPQANTTVILYGFQSQHVDSKDSLDRRGELMDALNNLVQGHYHSTYEDTKKAFLPRIVGCTQRPPEYFEDKQEGKELNKPIIIKVPSFESRTSDIQSIAKAKISQLEKSFSALSNVQLSKEGTQLLLDHKWEVDGESELGSELYMALQLLASEKKWNPFTRDRLEPRHLLVNAYNEKIRKRLLYDVPFLRQIIMSPWVFGKTMTYIVVPAFILVNLILILGPQSREENFALTIFWAGWWPGIMLVFPFLGRIWCAICPFMAVGNIAQDAAVALGVELRKWPSWAKEGGPAFAFGELVLSLMFETPIYFFNLKL